VGNAAANTFGGYLVGTSVGNDVIKNTNELDTLDLSSYSESDVTQTQTGNDLVIDLGSDGSVTVEDYYATLETNRLNISFQKVFDGIAIAEDSLLEDNITIETDFI
jgi:serralysin